jgi:hypothetical protein
MSKPLSDLIISSNVYVHSIRPPWTSAVYVDICECGLWTCTSTYRDCVRRLWTSTNLNVDSPLQDC